MSHTRPLLGVFLILLLAATAWGQQAAPERGTLGRITGVEAPNTEFDLSQNTGHFWGEKGRPVVLTTTDGRITAMDMVGQYGKPQPGARTTIVKVDASGGVTVDGEYIASDGVRRLIRATAERASYSVTDRTVALAGSVKGTVVEPDRGRTVNLDSSRATIDLGNNMVRLSEVKLVFEEEESPAAPAPAPAAK